jgi:purine-nucleoside phosphorylase
MSSVVDNIKKYTGEVREAAAHLRGRMVEMPQIAVVAGSGLSGLAELVAAETQIPYAAIPHYPHSTIPGHKGEVVSGRVGEKAVVILLGRSHLYEEESVAAEGSVSEWVRQVVFPIHVLNELGVRILILTNAAGALNPDFEIGDLMLVSDHLNFTFRNPLIGPNVQAWGPRFPDMSEPYASELCRRAREIALAEKISLKEGVYVAMLGPSYETPAEVEMLRRAGADAVGMSTVPETLAAIHCGIRILGISLISNSLVKGSSGKVTHEEVLDAARSSQRILLRFLRAFIQDLMS